MGELPTPTPARFAPAEPHPGVLAGQILGALRFFGGFSLEQVKAHFPDHGASCVRGRLSELVAAGHVVRLARDGGDLFRAVRPAPTPPPAVAKSASVRAAPSPPPARQRTRR